MAFIIHRPLNYIILNNISHFKSQYILYINGFSSLHAPASLLTFNEDSHIPPTETSFCNSCPFPLRPHYYSAPSGPVNIPQHNTSWATCVCLFTSR